MPNQMNDRHRFLSPIVLLLSARSATHDRLSFQNLVDGHQDKNQQEERSVGELEESKQFNCIDIELICQSLP